MLKLDSVHHLCSAALKEIAGPALLLDSQLKIVGGTPGIEELLGEDLPLGVRAPQVLCGEGDKRPVAEALARGEPVSAELIRPQGSVDLIISARSTPLLMKGKVMGHLLMLAPVGLGQQGITNTHGVLTASESMRTLLRMVEKVAPSDASILVRGETGSGKELIARAIHELSPRKDKKFAAINCAALPPQLIESVLFGHEKGAFTGAVRSTLGTFREAEGGTIFLDEVAELPLDIQAKLLRVTQERTVIPVGGTQPIAVDVRLVSATHRALREEVAEGRFRADLMYRLRVIPLFLPSLRERPLDIPPLVERFISLLNAKNKSRAIERVSPAAISKLVEHSWPGNVRELQNVMEYAFLLGEGPVLSEGDLPPEVRGEMPERQVSRSPETKSLPREAARIQVALQRANGNRDRTALSLGMSRSTLWRKMRKYNLDASD